MVTTSGRAAPLAPDERRDALVSVFLELARGGGRVPTTSEIAKAAGVAEGTIFRAYPTKEALLVDAVQVAFCPAPVRQEFLAIDRHQPMRERLVAFTAILQRRFVDAFGLMAALGLTQPPNRGDHLACFEAGTHVRSDNAPDDCDHSHDFLLTPVHALVEPDEITVPVDQLLHRLRLLTFSASHAGIADGLLLTPEEIVDTILYGVQKRPTQTGSGLGIDELYVELTGESLSDPPSPPHSQPHSPPHSRPLSEASTRKGFDPHTT